MREELPTGHTQETAPKFETFSGSWKEGFDDVRRLRVKSGVVALGTDSGGRGGENEDALFLDTDLDAFAAIDGIGGYEKGEIASQIVAVEMEKALHLNFSPVEMHRNASIRMRERGIRDGGAVYASVQIRKKEALITHAGDARVIITDPKGRVVFTTEDTELSWAPRGRSVGNPTISRQSLMNYFRILATTDGLLQNVNIERAMDLMKTLPVERVVRELAEMAKTAMQVGYYEDGQGNREYGNKDNLAIALYEILPVPLRGK